MAHAPSPENDSFIENTIEYLQDTVSREDLQLLLTQPKIWEVFVAEAELSRNEADALYQALTEHPDDKDVDLQVRKLFLKVFPPVKKELQECIQKLRRLADQVDQLHRDCTITNMLAGSTSAASGLLAVLSMALAPVAAGGSLVLSATAMVLGVAAAGTAVGSMITEELNTWSAEAEASHLASTSEDRVKGLADIVYKVAPKIVPKGVKFYKDLKSLGNKIQALRQARASSHLIADAKRLMTTRGLSPERVQQVKEAFKGTPLAMTKGARMAGAATRGLFFLMDVYYLVQDSKHLRDGAKAESAEELRQEAQELERKLEELIRIHESLHSSPTE